MHIDRNLLFGKVSIFLSELLKDTKNSPGDAVASDSDVQPNTSPIAPEQDQVPESHQGEAVQAIVTLIEKLFAENGVLFSADSKNAEVTADFSGFARAESIFSRSAGNGEGTQYADSPRMTRMDAVRPQKDLHAWSVHTEFSLLAPLAQGGLGKVSVATDQQFSRRVAIKEVKDEYSNNPSVRSRFLREASITGHLQHPSIVPVYGIGEKANGDLFYAMKLIDGESLKNAIKRQFITHSEKNNRKWPDTRQLLQRFLSAANAVAYAHKQGIVHRDIKPDNIMLGDFGETIVVDWGLALGRDHEVSNSICPQPVNEIKDRRDGRFTRHGMIIGTPGFMSPEQASGKNENVGPESDIYSLGATLTFMLTGRTLVTGVSVSQLLENTIQGRTILCEASPPGVPKSLWSVCRKACAVDSADRYKSVQELTQDVERFLSDEAVLAHVDSMGERLTRWIRKNPAKTVALGLSIFFSFAIAATGYLLQRNFSNQLFIANAKYVSRSEEFQHLVQKSIADLIERREFRGPEYAAIRVPLLRNITPAFESLLKDEITDSTELQGYASHLEIASNLYHEIGEIDEAYEKLWEYRKLFGIRGRIPPKTTSDFEKLLSVLQMHTTVQIEKGELSEADQTIDMQLDIIGQLLSATNEPKYFLELANIYATRVNFYRYSDFKKQELTAEYCDLALDALAKAKVSESDWDWFDRYKYSTVLQIAALFHGERRQQGDFERFRELQMESLEIREDLHTQYPTLSIITNGFAESNRLLASITLEFLGPNKDVKSHLDVAKSIQLRLVNRFPEVAEYCQNIADTDHKIGLFHLSAKEMEAAARHFDYAVSTCRDWETRNGESLWSGRLIALSLDKSSIVAAERQDLDLAIEYASSSMEAWARLAKGSPEDLYFQVREAGSRTNMATWLRRQGFIDKTIPLLTESITQLDHLESRNGEVAELRNNLLISHHSLAISYSESLDHMKAAEHYQAAAAYASTSADREKLLLFSTEEEQKSGL
jgi:serine/threonine protein kinase